MNALMMGYEAQVQAAVPYLKESLPMQQQQILTYVLGGLALGHAIKAAGCKGVTIAKLHEDEVFMKYIDYFSTRHVASVKFEVEDAHTMLLETHRKSINATEELNTIKELISLHGLAAPKKQINVNEHHVYHAKDMRTMSDAKLLELAGDSVVIDIEPEAIEYDDND